MPIAFQLDEACRLLGGRLMNGAERRTRPVSGVVIDHRAVTPDSLFVALPGTRTHGRHYAVEAVAGGAAAVLLDGDVPPSLPAWQCDDAQDMLERLGQWAWARHGAQAVGITGSVGKTSTKVLTEAVLRRRWRTEASPRSFNTAIGLPLAVLGLDPATDWFVAEMGMRAEGEIRRLCELIPPQVAVLTNIGLSHIGELGSQEAIWRAKSEILERLPEDGAAVLNAADPWIRRLSPAHGTVYWYGMPGTRVWAEDLRPEPGAVAFMLTGDGFREPVRLPWDGAHQVMNAVAAAAVGLVLGLEPGEAAAGLMAVDPASGHFHRVKTGVLTILDDTFNASPDSMRSGLAVLASTSGRRVAVLGDMLELGLFEESAHRALGPIAAASADVLVTVGARAQWIGEAACQPGLAHYHARDRTEAWAWLRRALRPGDTVYVKASHAMEFNHLVKDLVSWDGISP